MSREKQDSSRFFHADVVPMIRKQATRLLNKLYDWDEADAIVKILMQDVLEKPYHIALADNTLLEGETLIRLEKYIELALKGIPWQHILGKTNFLGLELLVNPDVLIPRPETEELVNLILKDIRKNKSEELVKLLDAGTGSGCIAIALASKLRNAEVWAVDASEKALKIARMNADRNHSDVRFLEADLLTDPPLALPMMDIIVSNPPYVLEEERQYMHKNVLDNEPDRALFVPNDQPLLFYTALIHWAKLRLNRGGALYLEINERFGLQLVDLLQTEGFSDAVLFKDFREKNRIIRAMLL